MKVSSSDTCIYSKLFEAGCIIIYLYVDDILIFVEGNDTYMKNLHNALSLFEIASGLKINLTKSTISPINVPTDRAFGVANLWGFTNHFLLVHYFGENIKEAINNAIKKE